LQTIRVVFPFLRTFSYPSARVRTKKLYRRAALRSIRRHKSRVARVSFRRRMLTRRLKYKQKSIRGGNRYKGSLAMRKKLSFRKRATSLCVSLRLRSLLKFVRDRSFRRKLRVRSYLKQLKRRSQLKRKHSSKRVKHLRKLERRFFFKRAKRFKKLKL